MRLLLSMALLSLAPVAGADDWPQYLGPGRDAVWREEGVDLDFKKSPPRLKWAMPIGGGYAGPSVAGGLVYVMDRKAEPFTPEKLKPGTNVNFVRASIPGKERLLCFDEATGEVRWKKGWQADYTSVYPYAIGPRATPVVEGHRVYALGAEGELRVHHAITGALLWRKNILKEYEVETPLWGTAGQPLIYGELLICLVGGKGATVVAFNKRSGREVWRALDSREAGYGTPVIETVNGHRQLLIWDAEYVSGLNPDTGEIYWKVEYKPTYAMAIGAPRVWKDLVYVMGFNGKSAAIRVAQDGKSAKLLWGRDIRKGVSGVMNTAYVRDGYVYSGGRRGLFRCVELETGKRLWGVPDPLLKADGSGRGPWPHAFTVHHIPSEQTLIFNDHGEMISAKLSPQGYQEQARVPIIDPTHTVSGRLLVWSHPALANGCVFCRNDKEIRCWELGTTD